MQKMQKAITGLLFNFVKLLDIIRKYFEIRYKRGLLKILKIKSSLFFEVFFFSDLSSGHMVSVPHYNRGLNLKICQNFVGTNFFLTYVGG